MLLKMYALHFDFMWLTYSSLEIGNFNPIHGMQKRKKILD